MCVNHNLEFFFNSLVALVFVYMIVRFLSWSWKLCVFITAGPMIKLCAGGGNLCVEYV